MTDERDKDKLEQDGAATPVVETPPAVDTWAKAFDALEEPPAPAVAGDPAGPLGDAPTGLGADGAAPPTPGAGTPGSDALVGPGDAGGSVSPAAGAGEGDGAAPVDVEAVVAERIADIEKRALQETAQLFIDSADEQGRKRIRQTDGRLGATINDSDIYQVDPTTGAPTFYNPDTGRPFTGDNPRAQAKAWVDAYNEELRETFNKFTGEREEALRAEAAPVIELLKFTPTFEALDPTRQKMLEALIEEYEVLDAKGVHIGYSCDLSKALAQVNRQVESIQASQRASHAANDGKEGGDPPVPTGPALDMPNAGSGTSGQRPEFKSLGEAMEWQQNQELANGQKK
jgi:hypothetical protein